VPVEVAGDDGLEADRLQRAASTTSETVAEERLLAVAHLPAGERLVADEDDAGVRVVRLRLGVQPAGDREELLAEDAVELGLGHRLEAGCAGASGDRGTGCRRGRRRRRHATGAETCRTSFLVVVQDETIEPPAISPSWLPRR
jgi:hypothetical protein